MIHTAAARPPSATLLVSSGRRDGCAVAMGRREVELLGGKSKCRYRDVAARWVPPLPVGAAPLGAGALGDARGADSPSPGDSCAAAVSLLLCSCRVLDLQIQHTGLSERRNVPPSVTRSSGDALFFFFLFCYVGDGVTLHRSAAQRIPSASRGEGEGREAGLSWHRCPLRMCDISRHEGEKAR